MNGLQQYTAGWIDQRQPVNTQHPLNSGLIGWWLPFGSWTGDNTLRDLLKKSDGAGANGPLWVVGVNGFGSPMFSNAANSLFSTPAITDAPTSTSKASFFSWINPSKLDSYYGIVENRGGSAGFMGLLLNGAANSVTCSWTNSSAEYDASPGLTLSTNQWSFVGAVVNGGTITLYRYSNGTYGTATISITPTAQSMAVSNWTIGADSSTPTRGWNGFLTDIRVYGRALSTAEVNQLYSEACRGYPTLLNRIRPQSFVSVAGGTPTLSADVGTFSLSGQSVNLRRSLLLPVTNGSFTLSGQSVGLDHNRTLTADNGSYSLSGQSANLQHNRTLTTSNGSFSLSGQSVGLDVNRVLVAANGSYVLNGQDVTLTVNSGGHPTADTGFYSLSGQSVSLLRNRTLSVSNGSFSLTGQSVNLQHNHTLPAINGSYSLNGQSVGFIATHKIAVDTGLFTLAGQTAHLVGPNDNTTSNDNLTTLFA